MLAVGLLSSACGSDDEASGGGAAGTGGSAAAVYPEGPYGHTVDSIFPNLQWQGYVNETAMGLASEQPFVPYSMDDVRKSGKRYALVHASEFW